MSWIINAEDGYSGKEKNDDVGSVVKEPFQKVTAVI